MKKDTINTNHITFQLNDLLTKVLNSLFCFLHLLLIIHMYCTATKVLLQLFTFNIASLFMFCEYFKSDNITSIYILIAPILNPSKIIV